MVSLAFPEDRGTKQAEADAVIANCLGKLPYATRDEAQRVIKRMLHRHARKNAWCSNTRLVSYKCRCCGEWHVGNTGEVDGRGR